MFSKYRRFVQVIAFCAVALLFTVCIVTAGSARVASLLNTVTQASGLSSAPGWISAPNSESDLAGRDLEAALATNGRIFYSNSQNSNSNIVSFLPGNSPSVAGTSLGRGFQPAVSPDGTKVAFVDNTTGSVATGGPIMLMNPDGTGRRALPNPAVGFTPAWSPDGTRLAYVVGNDSGGSGGSGDIWVMDMAAGSEGANQKKIPNTRNAQAPNWGVNNFLVWWSRDGVFGIAKLGPVPATSQIDTGSPLPTRLPGVQTFDVEPVWSPDATKIAFNSVRDYPSGGGSEIYTMDANGGSQTRLTSIAGSKASPTWAPDGTAIAFEHNFVLKKVFANGSDGANPPSVQTSGFIYNRLHWASAPAAARDIRIVNATGRIGEPVVVPVELVASGNEASISFSVNFDSLRLGFVEASLGGGVPAGANLTTNEQQVGLGRLGVLVDSTNTFTSGVRRFVNLTFIVRSSGSQGVTPITFGNAPTQQSVSSLVGASLPTNFQPGSVNITAAAVNGKIVYQRGGRATSDVYTVTPGTGISVGLRRGFHPVYSPDGTKIVFTDNTTGPTNGFLMIMNADGTNARQLSTPRQGFTPTWSRDGSRLAFVRGDFESVGDNGKGQLYIIDMTDGGEGANEVLIPTTQLISKPSWGAANRIAAAGYTPRAGGGVDPLGVCVTASIPASSQIGSNPPSISCVSGTNTNDRDVTWSPDGARIGFISTRDYPMASASEIYTMNSDGSTAVRLTNVNNFKTGPTWSPDGTRIAFSRGNSNVANLSSVNVDGSNGTSPATITSFSSGDVFPNWGLQPAGTQTGVDLAMESFTDDTDPVARGSNYNYVFGLRNRGTAAATGVKIVFDPIPANIRVHPIMLNCSMATDRRVTCTFADIAPGATASRSVTFIADTEGTVNVLATVSSNQTDPDTSNNSLTQGTVIVVPADVALLDPVSPAQVGLGTNFTYQLRVANFGPAAARAVRLESTLSPELEFVSAASGCVRNGNRITCELGDIVDTCPSPSTGCPTGSVRQVSITARGIQPGVGAFAAKNDVVVTTQGSLDDFTFNNSRTIRTDILLRLELLGLETTQVIQDMANSMPLVQGKETVVRAHIKNLGPGNPQITGQLVGVRIEGSGGRTPLGTLIPLNTGGTIRALPNPSRGNLDDSLYFELPENWRQGNVELEFRGVDTTLTCAEPDGTPNCKTTVSLVPTNDLSIKFVFLTFSDTDGTKHTPSLTQLLSVVRELYGQLPIDGLSVDLVETTITKQRACAGSFTSVVKQLNDMRLNDCKTGDCKDYYMGLLTDQSACSGSPLNGQADLPGRASAVFVPTDRSNTRAHEFGHDLGLSHTNFLGTEACGNAAGNTVACTHTPADGTISTSKNQFDLNTAYGFDIGNWSGTRVYTADTADFMSYAAVRWPSASNYSRMFTCFTTRDCITNRFRPVGDSPENRPTQIAADRVVLIDGEVSLSDGATTLGSVFVGNATRPITMPEPGDYAVRFENSQGVEIASHSFRPSIQSEGDTASISLMLPWNDATRRIVITRDGLPVASRQASPNSPSVTVTSPNGGETLGGAVATFTWTASDPDGDTLAYALEYSSNNGTTWESLAINWNSTSFPVDLTKLPGSSQALFRVTASDGFNSAEDQSNATFTVPFHAPLASIATPENNRLYVGDQTIVLNGVGFDIEEGMLASANLSWSSDINGSLGTGSSLPVAASALAEGTHTITLTASDNTARVGTASISIRIFRVRPVLAPALSVGPTGLIFTAAAGSGLTGSQTVAIRNSGDGSLTWSATADSSWIRLGSSSGDAPSNAEVRVDMTGLAPGNYSGRITVTSSDVANSPQIVQVFLSVVQAPPATISGRVLTPTGLALRNATVLLTTFQGARRTATTSSFGLFSFADVPSGASYTISIASKRFRFAPRSIQVNGNLVLGDFVGLE